MISSSLLSSKFFSYIIKKEIKSCLPIVEEIKILEHSVNINFNSIIDIINIEKNQTKEKFYDKSEYLPKIDQFYTNLENTQKDKFTEKLLNLENNLTDKWISNNPECVKNLVQDAEDSVDNFKNCIIEFKYHNLNECFVLLAGLLENANTTL